METIRNSNNFPEKPSSQLLDHKGIKNNKKLSRKNFLIFFVIKSSNLSVHLLNTIILRILFIFSHTHWACQMFFNPLLKNYILIFLI